MKATFRSLEPEGVSKEDRNSALGDWYNNVRDKPLTELGIGDICRACRQQLFLEAILPLALDSLSEEPTAGELYDGELASVLAKIDPAEWTRFHQYVSRAKIVLTKALPSLDADVAAEVNSFLRQSLHQ